MKKKLLASFLNLLLGVAAGGELKPISGARAERAISAFSPAGLILLPAREILLEGKSTNGKADKGDLLVLFDSSTGHLLWTCPTFTSTGWSHELHLIKAVEHREIAVYADQDRLAAFLFLPNRPLEIYIRESTAKATSLDDAERKAFQEVGGELVALEHTYWLGWKRVPLPKALGIDFMSPQESAALGSAHFIDVARKSDTWEIILEGQWKEKVTIDDKYEVIKLGPVK